MHLGTPLLGIQRRDLFLVALRKLGMDRAHVAVDGRGRGGALFSDSSLVISQFGFHTRHPPMAAAGRNALRESTDLANRTNIIVRRVNPLI